jgi:hypothetical protein
MLRVLGVTILFSTLLIHSGMAAQQTPEALKCRANARAHAMRCKASDPGRKHPDTVYNCLTRGAGVFRNCCDRTPDPQACKSQIAQ